MKNRNRFWLLVALSGLVATSASPSQSGIMPGDEMAYVFIGLTMALGCIAALLRRFRFKIEIVRYSDHESRVGGAYTILR